MNTRKMIALILTCVLAIGMTACSTANNQQSDPSLHEGNPNTAGAGTEISDPVEPDTSEPVDNDLPGDETTPRFGESEISDENISISLSYDREGYTVNDVIGLSATVTNKSDKTVVFVKGSGSNSVPDAFESDLGGFSAMFRPFIMTMDYRMEHLEPGESVTYDLPYAPYVALTQDGVPSADPSIDTFKNDIENYKAAETGEVAGTIKFTYYIQENPAEETLYNIDSLEPIVLEGAIGTSITE